MTERGNLEVALDTTIARAEKAEAELAAARDMLKIEAHLATEREADLAAARQERDERAQWNARDSALIRGLRARVARLEQALRWIESIAYHKERLPPDRV